MLVKIVPTFVDRGCHVVEWAAKCKINHTARLEEITDRVNALNKHMKNVIQERQQNQSLLTAHFSQVQTEDHLLRLSQSEEDHLRQDLCRINKAFSHLGERHNSLQNDIFKHTEKLEQLKVNVKWDKNALLAWEEEMARGEEDNYVIVRAFQEDDSRAKELELKRERLQQEVMSRKQLLERVVREVCMLEQVLDRTGKLFRKVHQERQDMIAQWEGSVRVLHQRDSDIHNTVQEINIVRTNLRTREEELREQKQFYDNEVNNNKEMNLQIAQVSHTAAKLRDELARLKAMVTELNNELKVVQRTMCSLGNQLSSQRAKNKQIHETILSKKERVESLINQNNILKDRLTMVDSESASATDRVRQLEEMLQVEEKTVHLLDVDIERLHESLFRAQQVLFNLRKEEEVQLIKIKGCELAKNQIHSHATNLDKEVNRQKEIIYNLDYSAQRIESRIAHLSGNLNMDEKEAHLKKIAELEEVLGDKTTTLNLLNSQINRLEVKYTSSSFIIIIIIIIIINCLQRLVSDTEELARLKSKRQDQMLLMNGGEKQLKVSQCHSQDRQVEENLLKLRVNQASKAISKEGNKVYTLERHRLEMEAAMKERQVEIATLQDLMLIKKRGLCEEKSKLIAEITERNLKVSQIQNRYENTMSSLGEGEDGEPLSITHLMLKSAQEKYMLQEEGDALDSKIRRAEKEIKAMENTLVVVNATNDTYKKSLAIVDEDSPEYQEKAELESQYYAAIEKLRYFRTQLSEINNDVKGMEESQSEMVRTDEELLAELHKKEQEQEDLRAGTRDQQMKIQRADKQLRRLVRELKGSGASKVLTVEEVRLDYGRKDIETRELQDQNQTALQHLALMMTLHIETGPVIKHYLSGKGLNIPQRSTYMSTTPCSSHREDRQSLAVASPPSQPSSSQFSDRSSVRSQTSTVASPSIVTLDPNQLQVKSNLIQLMGVHHGYKPLQGTRAYLLDLLPESRDEIPERCMQDSFTSAIIPLSTDQSLQDKYVTFLGSIRIGRLLEDMDMFAVWVAHQHISNPKMKPGDVTPYVIVTVLVDQISFTDLVAKSDADIRLSGHVSWVGRSSIEVVVWLEQNLHGQWQKLTRALFLMAARNSTNTAAAIVNKLVPKGEKEIEIFAGGEDRKRKRQQEKTTSLLRSVPDATEQRVIHDLFLKTVDMDSIAFDRRKLSPNSTWMSDAKLSNIIFSHPEDRNLHNKVFGGFLMRQAMELSWMTGYLYSLVTSRLTCFHYQVAFTQQNYMQIVVFAEVFDASSGHPTTTNVFHYTYKVPEVVPDIIPNSYNEAMRYLEGRRHFIEVFELDTQ
uniref:Coiled-coil domain-containing protein 39 n=1 Tax=Timema bartmani TaxID=61472 RepID=A0A7R9EN11_9NEOP|nr:unnamed protein product [Timema bartmani]